MSLPTIAGYTPPSSPLLGPVLEYVGKHCSLATLNHSIRPVYFALVFAKKLPPYAAALESGALNMETLMLALLMHDLGWATTKELLSKDKRFEVDGAELAVKFIQDQVAASKVSAQEWDKYRLETMWNAIGLHAQPPIAGHHPNPNVSLCTLAIGTDFFGPNLGPPFGPPGVLAVDEYKAIVKGFPREGFKEDMIQIMCGFCRDKPSTTLDTFVGQFGMHFGTDGKGGGREEFTKMMQQANLAMILTGALDACAEVEKEI